MKRTNEKGQKLCTYGEATLNPCERAALWSLISEGFDDDPFALACEDHLSIACEMDDADLPIYAVSLATGERTPVKHFLSEMRL